MSVFSNLIKMQATSGSCDSHLKFVFSSSQSHEYCRPQRTSPPDPASEECWNCHLEYNITEDMQMQYQSRDVGEDQFWIFIEGNKVLCKKAFSLVCSNLCLDESKLDMNKSKIKNCGISLQVDIQDHACWFRSK